MTTLSCQRAPCTGLIVDGICEDCGRAPVGKKLLAAEPSSTRMSTPLSTSSSTSSANASQRTATHRADAGTSTVAHPAVTPSGGQGAALSPNAFDPAGSVRASTIVSSMKVSSAKVRGTASYPMSRSKQVQGTGRAGTRRSTHTANRTSIRRRALGGGLVSLPPMPSLDPVSLLMAVPVVPERKRKCPSCGHRLKLVKGFCPNHGCGQPYDFNATLKAGDVIATQYEIKGPIAYGGLGWVYLGWDRTLSRWVILKGLLNARDEASAAVALAERQFLAAVNFSKIVGIYNFVNHGTEGFIVMEFVGGRTIATLRQERGPLPVDEAIAYVLGILPAFSYLHARGFVYCDFKPDNFMVDGDDVKLIDMGAVRKIGDPDGDLFATAGYMAPEGASDPREVSDLYSVARTLATLVMEFRYVKEYEYTLPTPDEQAVLAQNESLYRFLLRATHPDPDERFQTADEMFDQLYGVLREIVALKSSPKPADSKAFSSDNLLQPDDAEGTQAPLPRLLPFIKVAPEDPAANDILRLASVTQLDKRIDGMIQLVGRFGASSVEARLRLADALVNANRVDEARTHLDAVEQDDAYDWRVQWVRGVLALTAGDAQAAYTAFEKVYFEMPGEIAPKLAMGFAAELAGDAEIAAGFYDRVSRVDPNQVSACFGLARCHVAAGDVRAAVDALARVPAAHSLSSQAHIETARLLLEHEDQLDGSLLQQTERAIRLIGQDNGIVHQLGAKLLSAALRFVGQNTLPASSTVLGQPFETRALRQAAEREYLQAAQYSRTPAERIKWVDLANRIRPVTLW